ncbi:arsenate reductase/protein-tyrosine-phosphatase family protein [Nocardioides bizhenqiangii]|uniref:Helix-turn-helix domain-containing protein n=1 Tax=Nocardioides bizhenqiangii TaxID=3095076 RepID=A0ABZ0ZWF2_9ACTN|nr:MULTISPECIES: helix-turn-helix domain-containing protein [unclassified Nocardioides]MDZ5623198.1 helix-turn-helix domain-containing protein [Nocardioides sp. HM23]WQQ28171.1 helix-turn-helix domain-containing protein [Nocardioides sp. HM61]
MVIEAYPTLEGRAKVHAALADTTRLRITDLLSLTDATASELGASIGIPSNLLAHHLRVLEEAGLIARQRSEGDGRRSYIRLVPAALDVHGPESLAVPRRVVFVCTANSARSHIAAAMWRQASAIPAASAGTHPAPAIHPGALAAAHRHQLPIPRRRPRAVNQVLADGDLVITVCDRAHEELAGPTGFHWSVPDPVAPGTDAAFDAAYDHLATRVTALEPRLRTA